METQTLLRKGIEHHQRGEWEQAIKIYRDVLENNPNDGNALHLLGVLCHDRGDFENALEFIQKALKISGPHSGLFFNLGNAYHASKKTSEAIQAFGEAIRLQPDYVDAYIHRGVVFRDAGDFQSSIQDLQKAIQLDPTRADAYFYLALAFHLQSKWDQAIKFYRRSIELQPRFIHPLNNLANCLKQINEIDEAQTIQEKAIRFEPQNPQLHFNLANTLRDRRNETKALEHFRKAIELRPSYAEAYTNLGNLLRQRGDLTEAKSALKRAIELDPDLYEAHSIYGMLLLLDGNSPEGWREYEWREKRGDLFPKFERPRWRGESLKKKTLLIVAEQALGDAIQFVRFVPMIKARGAKTILRVPRKLHRLFRGIREIDQIVGNEDTLKSAEYDYFIPLLSLPYALNLGAEELASEIPYLQAEPELIQKWKLDPCKKLRVGIAWQGSKAYAEDRERSIPLEAFAELVERFRSQIDFYSLQKGEGEEQIPVFSQCSHLKLLGEKLDLATDAFVDTAAVLKNLDLFITSDSAVAHLAGALGVKTWLLLAKIPDWRWNLHRDDSPWYPKVMKLIRQTERGDWAEVFDRVKIELESLVG